MTSHCTITLQMRDELEIKWDKGVRRDVI